MIKAIIDTNVIFSALYKPKSTSGLIIMLAIDGIIDLIAPISVRDEIVRKLKEKLKFNDEEIRSIIISLPVEWIEEEVYKENMEKALKLINDKTDAPLIAIQLLTGYPIITGDKELTNSSGEAYSPSNFIRKLLSSGIIDKAKIKKLLNEIDLIMS